MHVSPTNVFDHINNTKYYIQKLYYLITVRSFMYVSGKSTLPTFVLLTLVIVAATGTGPIYAQQRPSPDNPFVVVFTLAGVNNSTGEVASWVTANNVTRSTFYNASQVDLLSPAINDGFVEGIVTLPNGTLEVGDEYMACTIILKDKYLTCEEGFNAPTNRAEFADVTVPKGVETKRGIQ
jgi:hypothetical protein